MTQSRSRTPEVAVACGGAFISAMSTSLVSVAAPRMAHDLHTSPDAVGWVLTVYLLGLSAFLATAGRLADVLGRRRVYVAGFALFALASLACALAPTLPLLVAARVVQSMGASATMATGPAIITSAFPPEKRARGLGYQLTATYLGLSLGPTVGGILTAAIGWPAVFAAVAAAATLGTLFAARLLPPDEAASPRARALDPGGAVLLGVALVGFSLALRRDALLPWWGWVVLGVASSLAYARHARAHPAPVLSLALVRSRAFLFGIAGAVILYVVIFIQAWLLPFHLQDELHLDPARAGLVMTAQPAMLALVAPLSGVLADRFGARLPCVLAMLLLALGFGLVAVAVNHGEAAVAGALLVVGAGGGLYAAPNNAVIMAAAPREAQGSAGAMAATARNFGMASGVAIAIALRARFSFSTALAVAASFALVGALFGTARPK